MKLLYSGPRKTPFIKLDSDNDSIMIFSVNTEHEVKGFKWLCVNGRATTTVVTSGAKAKKVKSTNICEDVSFTVGMDIKRPNGTLPKTAKTIGLTPATIGFLRKTMKLLVDDEGYFPRANLPTLEKMLEKINGSESDTWDDDPTITDEDD